MKSKYQIIIEDFLALNENSRMYKMDNEATARNYYVGVHRLIVKHKYPIIVSIKNRTNLILEKEILS